MIGLQISHLDKSFGTTRAVVDVSLEVGEGEIVALLGPSGCGKSTILALIAGLEKPDHGELFWNDQPLQNVPPHRRDFGLMFQDYALFPHMNVFDNVAFGLRMSGFPEEQVMHTVHANLELVGLPGFDSRDVLTLSGGEQQRVALARSLAPQPRLLMLDEPLGSLDRGLRERLVDDLKRILKPIHQTAIYVTHDQEEAFVLADRIVLLNAGQVEQIGTARELYHQPATEFTARFLGLTNFFSGEIRLRDGMAILHTPLGQFTYSGQLEGKVNVLLRPGKARISETGGWSLQGTILEHSFRGSQSQVVVLSQDVRLKLEVPSDAPLPAVGEQLQFSFNPDDALQVFAAGS